MGDTVIARQRRRVARRASADEEGSVMILTIGYAVLALVAVLVCVDATSLYLAQKRLDALADAAALAGADAFTLEVVDDEPVAALDSDDVRDQVELLLGDLGSSATVVSASSPDGLSARVTIAGTWHPPVLTLFVPEGVALEATATSRTALG